MLRVPGSRPTRSGWFFVPLDMALNSKCSVVLMYKGRVILPGTVDCMSKYVTASRTRVSKGDCRPTKSPAVTVNTNFSGARYEDMKIHHTPPHTHTPLHFQPNTQYLHMTYNVHFIHRGNHYCFNHTECSSRYVDFEHSINSYSSCFSLRNSLKVLGLIWNIVMSSCKKRYVCFSLFS